ncbi:metal-sensitive transcriptional regulator [Bacillus sp. JCM 19034]|uniref:metal-sensitive transcriptional regulator n=1 Tax=Bacillus sp. JCM 19034 TaxID=1481928 RepID=UPI000785EBE6|nr:metal-sensitive transcriptional regulator [Bacillus sp. JCM 19034]
MSSEKHTHRQADEKTQLLNRLKRIEGQVRGIQKMVEEDRYCVDILIQISAIQAAMKKVSLNLMENHTKHCVKGAIKKGEGDEVISELMEVIEKIVK